MTAALIGFAFAFGLIFARVPVAIALAVVGGAGFAILQSSNSAVSMLVFTTASTTMSYYLAVVPLFVLMGNLIAGAGVSAELYRAAQAFVGRRRGGLAMATVLSCGGFAAVCGSSVATAVTMGRIAIPSMRQYGYADAVGAATVAAGGTLGVLIPPSTIMVIYGITTETNIGHLFAAGLIPGLIGVLGYLIAVRWFVFRNPESAPAGEKSSNREKLRALRDTWTVMVLFIIVLGGIYSGYFTAIEAGGIGASGAFFIALMRRVSIQDLYVIFRDTALTTAVLFAIIIGAHVFTEFVNLTGAHRTILSLVAESGLNGAMIIVAILLVYIVLGCVLDSLGMMLLTLPLFFPIVIGLGYDPVWFGIVVVIAIELGLITPPMGMNLFIVRSVAPEVPLATIIRGIIPFVVADIVRLFLIAAFPAIALWLPHLLF